MTDKENFLKQMETWNIEVSGNHLELLQLYVDELLEKNKIFNLISNKDAAIIWTRHITDSIAPLKKIKTLYPSLKNKLISDAGSGAGLPGIPLKILLEEADFKLYEPNLKRRNFLMWLFSKLKLKKIEASNERIGENQSLQKGKTDILIERAMGQLENILPQCLNMIKEDGGLFYAWHANAKILQSPVIKDILKKMNADICDVQAYKLAGEEKERFILILRRKKCTY
ncbi:MAG: 16S rRNA (guanine(527)-N(7))-methyltransferase RsmG [Elusimicrobiota bacterium]|nr:16S rRNA (guanine(527)-N(7))-methyltransferase RsmG [Elusimicrobiota bacterium]